MGAAGKEYGNGDSRYVTSDGFTVIMESFTAFVEGPLALLVRAPRIHAPVAAVAGLTRVQGVWRRRGRP